MPKKRRIGKHRNSIDWTQTESEFVAGCTCPIDSVGHIYNDYEKTNSDYQISRLALGKYDCTARVYVDSLQKTVLFEYSF